MQFFSFIKIKLSTKKLLGNRFSIIEIKLGPRQKGFFIEIKMGPIVIIK